MIAPGAANDIQAYRRTSLKEWVDGLPVNFYVVGDNAYILSEHLLTPFFGSDKSIEAHDTFNFYLLQLRI
jgi:hypothetical protein